MRGGIPPYDLLVELGDLDNLLLTRLCMYLQYIN